MELFSCFCGDNEFFLLSPKLRVPIVEKMENNEEDEAAAEPWAEGPPPFKNGHFVLSLLLVLFVYTGRVCTVLQCVPGVQPFHPCGKITVKKNKR